MWDHYQHCVWVWSCICKCLFFILFAQSTINLIVSFNYFIVVVIFVCHVLMYCAGCWKTLFVMNKLCMLQKPISSLISFLRHLEYLPILRFLTLLFSVECLTLVWQRPMKSPWFFCLSVCPSWSFCLSVCLSICPQVFSRLDHQFFLMLYVRIADHDI